MIFSNRKEDLPSSFTIVGNLQVLLSLIMGDAKMTLIARKLCWSNKWFAYIQVVRSMMSDGSVHQGSFLRNVSLPNQDENILEEF